MQRSIIDSAGRKIVQVVTPMPRRVVRSLIHGVGIDRHGTRKLYLLPPRGALPCERGRGQQRPRAAPQVTQMRARVIYTFVEANAGDVAAYVRLKRHARLEEHTPELH